MSALIPVEVEPGEACLCASVGNEPLAFDLPFGPCRKIVVGRAAAHEVLDAVGDLIPTLSKFSEGPGAGTEDGDAAFQIVAARLFLRALVLFHLTGKQDEEFLSSFGFGLMMVNACNADELIVPGGGDGGRAGNSRRCYCLVGQRLIDVYSRSGSIVVTVPFAAGDN